jgi:hypothetical protein
VPFGFLVSTAAALESVSGHLGGRGGYVTLGLLALADLIGSRSWRRAMAPA